MVGIIRDYFDDYVPPPPPPPVPEEVPLTPQDEDWLVAVAATRTIDEQNDVIAKAAMAGSVNVLRMAMKIGYELSSALLISARAGHTAGVRTLLASGYFDNQKASFADAFILAAGQNNTEIMAMLQNGVNPAQIFPGAAKAAGEAGADRAITYLAGAFPVESSPGNNAPDSYKRTLKSAFQSAAAKGRNDTAKLALRLLNRGPSKLPAAAP